MGRGFWITAYQEHGLKGRAWVLKGPHKFLVLWGEAQSRYMAGQGPPHPGLRAELGL